MGGLSFQAGADSLKVSRDARLGIISAVAKCYAPDLQTAVFASAIDIGLGIPEWNARKVSRREAGESAGYDVEVNYEGVADPDNADGQYFEIEGSTTEDPIETHWNYAVLLANYNGSEDSSGTPHWPKTLTDKSAGTAGRNPMHGVTAWPAPGLIWNHNWTSKNLPVSIVQQLGSIGDPPGNPPELSGNRAWLCIRVRGRQRGNIWQMQTSYQLSGPYGYVPEMYQRV